MPMEPDRARRYNNRTTAERFNSELKDNHGFFDGAGKRQQESACASDVRRSGDICQGRCWVGNLNARRSFDDTDVALSK